MFACVAIHRSAEPGTLVVRLPFKDRDRLIAEAPDTFYLTDHYVNYPVVLVRIVRCNREALNKLLRVSSTFVASGARVSPRRNREASKALATTSMNRYTEEPRRNRIAEIHPAGYRVWREATFERWLFDVVRQGTLNAFSELGAALSVEVLGSRPVVVHICDERFRTVQRTPA